jgi:hypothetical protein
MQGYRAPLIKTKLRLRSLPLVGMGETGQLESASGTGDCLKTHCRVAGVRDAGVQRLHPACRPQRTESGLQGYRGAEEQGCNEMAGP